MSRPEIPIDWKKVDKLLIAGCLGTEIASHFVMHPNTFYDRVQQKFGVSFTEYSQEKKSTGDSILREKQFEIANKGNVTLLIWLGKNRLGQKDQEQNELKPILTDQFNLQNEVMSLKARLAKFEANVPNES